MVCRRIVKLRRGLLTLSAGEIGANIGLTSVGHIDRSDLQSTLVLSPAGHLRWVASEVDRC
jgi:hypothetical protein